MLLLRHRFRLSMFEQILQFLDSFDNFLWGYLGVPLIVVMGFYFSLKSGFMQIRYFPKILKNFYSLLGHKSTGGGVHPLKAFFASIGGAIGIGNVVAICTSVQIGGPGALFWIWITAIAGSILKYIEVFLGMQYRVSNEQGGYHGGPMYFLPKAFNAGWVASLVCVLLCLYGVEIYQFSVVTHTLAFNLNIEKSAAACILLFLVIYATSGGVKRVGQVSSFLIPLFLVCYLSMGAWVLFQNIGQIPHVFSTIFSSAFTGHAAIGGFAGSGILLTISQGMKRGCYAGDVGIGYASVIHSETSSTHAGKQASLAIFDILMDSLLICSTSVMIVLVTDVWKEPIDSSLLVQTALGRYFPYIGFFMPVFLFLLGYTTITAYFCTGLKCASYLDPRRGATVYYIYGACALLFFAFVDTSKALAVMSIVQAFLLLINLCGFYKLRHKISFDIENVEQLNFAEENLNKVKMKELPSPGTS